MARSEPLVIEHRTIDTPIGRLLVAASERGVHRIGITESSHAHDLVEVADATGGRLVSGTELTSDAVIEIEEYFDGERRSFDLPTDLSLVGGFQRLVIETLALIPYGDRWSYGAVAEAVGHPRAARAVGTACGANPIPLLYPCHRVIRSDGSIGFYGGGEHMKSALLELEADNGRQ